MDSTFRPPLPLRAKLPQLKLHALRAVCARLHREADRVPVREAAGVNVPPEIPSVVVDRDTESGDLLERRECIAPRVSHAPTIADSARESTNTVPCVADAGGYYRAMSEMYNLKRSIPVDQTYDLVVAGGGPAGTTAAIAAGRLGLRVLLVEASGALGGMGSSGLVSSWYCLGNNVETMVGGLTEEIAVALYERGAVEPDRLPEQWLKTKRGFGFDAEVLKILLDDLCADAGVEVRFATRVIDADVTHAGPEGHRMSGIVTHGPDGYRYIPAASFVDATGDAVLSEIAGVACRVAGQDTENIMPPTLCAKVTGLDYTRFDRRTQQQDAVDRAVRDGFFSQPDRHVPGLFRTGPDNAILNAGHLFDMDALDVTSLSDGYRLGRKLVSEYIAFFREYLDGCQGAASMGTAALMGVRESRRIVGEYELSWADFDSRRKFPDQIAIYCKQIDVHVYAPTDEEYERVYRDFDDRGRPADGEYYGIPYGVLVPKGWQNLWTAGRCVSTDIKVNGSLRDQPGCMLMGQAAGTAAAQHVRTNEPAHALNTATLVRQLRKDGQKLPQAELSDTMTRE